MMKRVLVFLFIVTALAISKNGRAQTQPKTPPEPQPKVNNPTAEIDSARKAAEEGRDSVVFTAKYIRYTTLRNLDDSTFTLPIDTSLRGLQSYNPQYDPYSPTLNLGNAGLSSRDMLFTPRRTIGFDAGFHALDRYLMTQDSVKYYRARTPFTQFWYVNGSQTEQFFQLTHTQNIKPNWNAAVVYKRIGADGWYQAQRGDHTNVMVSTWYHSANNRYNLLANALFNTLKAGENGSVADDNFFITNADQLSGASIGPTRLEGTRANRPAQSWKEREYFLRQYYYLGRLDGDSLQSVLPTQRISHTLSYTNSQYKFFRNERDPYHAFPEILPDSIVLTNDSTTVKDLRNEFRYSFYLRGQAVSFIKNEVKLDVGFRHDLYQYRQFTEHSTFQDITLLANASYRFSDRVLLDADLQQIIQGRDRNNFLYQANTSFLLSKRAGKIVLGAYVQNSSPEHIFERVDYQFHQWSLSFNNPKTSNLSFEYENEGLRLKAKAEYFLLNNYLYLKETSSASKEVIPVQSSSNMSLLKVSVGKDFSYRRFTLENFLVYQKTGYENILLTPEVYLYNSLYYSTRFFKAIDAQMGFDSRYNTPFFMPWYAVNISQFYVGQNVNYETFPVIDVWLKASLRRATIFLKQSYVNQGLLSNGYYTVSRYPMPNKLFVFGVKWNFYN